MHRFRFAKEMDIPDHIFARHVDKMLRCLLGSTPATKHLNVVFVDGENLRVDASFAESTWRIHAKWLTHEGAHGSSFCEEEATNHNPGFVCDDIVLQLWDIMISQFAFLGLDQSKQYFPTFLETRQRLSSVFSPNPFSPGPVLRNRNDRGRT